MKRALSVVLILVFVLSSFSVTAFADDECAHENSSWRAEGDGCVSVCDDCGERLSEVAPHDWVYRYTPPSSCAETGYNRCCYRCGDIAG